MNKMKLIAAVGAYAFVATCAFATSDNLIAGAVCSPTGDGPILPNWTPGNATHQFLDDGTNGDVTSNDNLYTHVITGAVVGTDFHWKLAGPSWNPQSPDNSHNYVSKVPASGNITFYAQTTAFNDGYVPDAVTGSPAHTAFCWSTGTREAFDNLTTVTLVGDFVSERGGNDWDIADSLHALPLTDAGNGTLGDGIFSAQLTGIPAGAYAFKAFTTSPAQPTLAWGNDQFNTDGFTNDGGNLSFNVLAPANVVTFTINGNTGRMLISNPALAAGPPFYAQSAAWSTGWTAAEDLGTAVGNVYSKVFTVATPGSYSVAVRQGLGRSFPNSGSYPFITTTPGQQVRVVFDRNTYADGAQPASDFIAVVDDASRASLNSFSMVQVMGNWQTDFGGSDWAAVTPGNFQQLLDDGATATDGDRFAGDGVYAVKLTALGNTNGSGAQHVGRLERTGEAGDIGQWNVKAGGATHGLVLSGGNEQPNTPAYNLGDTMYFQLDTVTGRLACGVNSNPARPSRPSDLPFASVQDWTSID